MTHQASILHPEGPPTLAGSAHPRDATAMEKSTLRSHSRWRRQRDRQLRQLPLLQDRLRRLQLDCDQLKQDLAASQQQEAVFRQDALTLRTLISFKAHPQLAEKAASEAAVTLLKAEVQTLRRRVRQLEQEKEKSLLQSEDACAMAEFYQQLSERLAEDVCEAQQGNAAVAGSEDGGTATLQGAVSIPEQTSLPEEVRRLRASIDDERDRSRAMVSAIESLQRALSGRQGSPAGIAEALTPFVSAVESSAAVAAVDAVSPSGQGDGESRADATRSSRYTAILRSQNRLLIKRVEELAQRNVQYAADVAALKLAAKQRCTTAEALL